MNHRRADDAAEEFRRAIAPIRPAVSRKPEDFGLRFLTPDELIEQAESVPDEQLPGHSFRRPMRVAAALLSAAAVIAGAMLVPRLVDGATPSEAQPSVLPTPTASRVESFTSSHDVFLAASSVRGPQTTGAPYWHVKSIQLFGTTEVPRELWIGNGRSSVLRQDGVIEELSHISFPAGQNAMGQKAVQNLPADPAELRRLLAGDSSSPSRDRRWAVFKAAGDLVAEAPLPPDVRSAVWKVLASVNGSHAVSKARDSVGRPGWLVSMSLPAEGSISYLVDTSSGQLLETRHVPVDGRESWRVTFLERGPADTAPVVTQS